MVLSPHLSRKVMRVFHLIFSYIQSPSALCVQWDGEKVLFKTGKNKGRKKKKKRRKWEINQKSSILSQKINFLSRVTLQVTQYVCMPYFCLCFVPFYLWINTLTASGPHPISPTLLSHPLFFHPEKLNYIFFKYKLKHWVSLRDQYWSLVSLFSYLRWSSV